MKCEKCGGNLTLEDVVCPHCEALNEHAVQHIRDMNRYKKDYEGTKRQVYSVTQKYAGFSVRMIIIAVLIVLIVVCGVLSGEAYSIRRKIMQADAKKNAASYKQQIDEFLEDRDYYAVAAFCNEHCIYSSTEEYEEYASFIYATQYYAYIYDYVLKTLKPYEGANMQNKAKYIAEHLDQFYAIFIPEQYSYRYIGEDEEDIRIALEMQEQIHALLMAYCGLTKEEADALPDMSSAERTLLIEEKLLHGE